MKKILLLFTLLFSTLVFSQAEYEKIALTENIKDSLALRVMVQSDSGELNYSLIEEFFTRSKITVDTLAFNSGGQVTWNGADFTINVETGIGPSLQVGQEIYTIVYNNSGAQIDNGKVVYPEGSTGGRPSINLAISDTHEKIERPIYVTTMDIPNASLGIATNFGYVRDVPTSGLIEGQEVYVSPTVAGDFTSTKPMFPDYDVRVGGATVIDAVNGVIFVDVDGRPEDTFIHTWDGSFREQLSFTVSSDGAIITGSLERFGGGDLTEVFSTGLNIFDTTPAATITLTAGTDTNPQINYVYLPESTGVITVSTSSFPADEHIKIADLFLQSAAKVQTDDALVNRNWNDGVKVVGNNGHALHIAERMRQNPAAWDSGVLGASTVDSPTNSNVYVSNTSGTVYQIHKEVFQAFDLATGDDVSIVNHFTIPYIDVTNLNAQILDALGVTLTNSSFSFVMWGVQNQAGEESHIMVNLPIGKYAKNAPANAVSDALNYSVYTIPPAFKGKGFLIARFTYVLEANGTDWSLYDTEDLRNTTGGGAGGGGGGGVTDFTGLFDTPSSYIGAGGYNLTVAGGENAVEFTAPIDEKTKVSANDTTEGYLNGKLVAGTNVTLIENNDGGDETLTINASFSAATPTLQEVTTEGATTNVNTIFTGTETDLQGRIKAGFIGETIDTSIDSIVTWDGDYLKYAGWVSFYNKIFTDPLPAITEGQYISIVDGQATGYIHTSDDAGLTWTARDSQRAWADISLSASGKYQVAAELSGLIYISSDFGETWTSRESSRQWRQVSVSADGKYMNACARFSEQIYTSDNFGSTWTARDSARDWLAIAMNYTGQYQSAAETGTTGIYVSNDYGVTWTEKTPAHSGWVDIDISETGQYQVATDGNDSSAPTTQGLYVSSDYGQTWAEPATALGQWWNSASVSGTGQYMTGSVNSTNLWRSTDYGATWTELINVHGWTNTSVSQTGQYQAATSNGLAQGVWYSTDHGLNWTQKTAVGVTPWNWQGIDINSSTSGAGSGVGGIPDNSVSKDNLKQELKNKIALGDVSGTVNIDASLGIHYSMNMTGNVTNLTFSNLTNEQLKTITLEITGDGSYTFFQPTSIKGDWSAFDSTLTNQIQIYMYDITTPIFTSGFFNF